MDEPSQMISEKVKQPFQDPGAPRLSLSMPYGLEKLSQEPSSLTERIWGSVRLVDRQVSGLLPGSSFFWSIRLTV